MGYLYKGRMLYVKSLFYFKNNILKFNCYPKTSIDKNSYILFPEYKKYIKLSSIKSFLNIPQNSQMEDNNIIFHQYPIVTIGLATIERKILCCIDYLAKIGFDED